jgi:hypothetical protein
MPQAVLPTKDQPDIVLVARSVEWCLRGRIRRSLMVDSGWREHQRLSRNLDRSVRVAAILRYTAYSSSEAPILSIPTKYRDALFVILN